jgi:hypothetical protein
MPLLSTVQDEDPYIRYFSIYTLARIADVRAMDNLVKALGDTKPNVRREAAIGLGNLRDRSAIDPLSRTATFDDSYEVRIWAIRSLKKIGGSEIISPLISLLNRQGDDFNGHFDDLRKFVSEEILEIGTSAIEFLLTALEEGNLNIRKSVLAILDKFEKIDDSKRFLAARDNLMRDLKLFTEARGIVSSAFSSGGNGPNNHIDYGSFTLKSDAVTNLPSFQRLEKLKTEGAFKGVSRIYIFNLADVEGESTLTKVSNLFDKSEDYHVTISAKKDLQKIYFDNVGSGFAGYFRVSKVTFCFYDEVSADNFVRGWKTLIEMFRSPEAR